MPAGFKAITNAAQIEDRAWTVAEEETEEGFTEILPEASLSCELLKVVMVDFVMLLF